MAGERTVSAQSQKLPIEELREKYQAEIIVDPDSKTIDNFHQMLQPHFEEGEIEPVEVFHREMRRNRDPESDARFILTFLRKGVSGAYGSIQEGTLAIRFTLTEVSDRGTGVSQEADRLLIETAEEIGIQKGKPLEALVGECVERSESYWNRMEIEPGNGMKRAYFPDTKEEIYYRLPPLEWNSDGTPSSDDVITEHLQVAAKGHPQEIPVARLKEIVNPWWDEWYIRPRDNFDSDQAWERHKETVKKIRDDFFQQFEGYDRLELIAKYEREKISPEINSEFGQLESVIWHDASNVLNMNPTLFLSQEEIAKHPEQGIIYKELFMEQHARLGRFLEDHGVKLVDAEPTKSFTQVYTRDPGFVIGDTLFIGRMKAGYREAEIEGLESVKRRAEKVIEIEQGVLEGGDVMVLSDNLVLVGIGDTTNEEGYHSLRVQLQAMGKEAIAISHTALHLDCALTPLPDGGALYSEDRIPQESREVLNHHFSELIPLDPEEDTKHLAANVLWLNKNTALSNVNAKKTNAMLRERGYQVEEFEYSQPVRMWGGIRCAVGPLVRQD